MNTENPEVCFGVQENGIWKKAWDLYRAFPGAQVEVNDLFNELVVKMYEQVEIRPALLEQQPGYLLNRAYGYVYEKMYRTRNQARSQQTALSDLSEIMATAETDVRPSLALREAFQNLTEYDQRICDLLYRGYRKGEVANMLEVSAAYVSKRLRGIREGLAILAPVG